MFSGFRENKGLWGFLAAERAKSRGRSISHESRGRGIKGVPPSIPCISGSRPLFLTSSL